VTPQWWSPRSRSRSDSSVVVPIPNAVDGERAQVPATLEPQLPEKLVERPEFGIRSSLDVNPELRAMCALDPEVERVSLARDVVGPTRPQMSAHPSFGVLVVTQKARFIR
jgi:hypothetical protein